MEERLKLMKASTTAKVDATLYRSIIDSLRYLVHMRPDIAFVVGYVSRFLEDPRVDHWATVKWLLRYIKGMVNHGIIFPKTGGSRLQLTVFSDVDMAGDIDERRSTSSVLIFLGSALISWMSLKQKVVVLSTCELTGVEAHPPALMVDNQPAIALMKNLVLHNQSKHIDVKFHFLRDYVDGGQIIIEFIETGQQLADVLTKPLGRLRLMELREMIGMEGYKG
ncbi:secreted RxLR effector protein 161-like [Miscanthus floridulus]|uniref:secreted RxLR effector protein 161-like n=1 Tax=Miscanthus floridulus TaxID=154761 RepID=UPI00345A7B1A